MYLGDVQELRARAEGAARLGRRPFASGTVQTTGVFQKPALGGITSPASALSSLSFLPYRIIIVYTESCPSDWTSPPGRWKQASVPAPCPTSSG